MARKFKKFTYDVWENELDKGKKLSDCFVDIVGTQIYGDTCDYEYGLFESVLDCESPMEQLLAIEMERLGIHEIANFNPFVMVNEFLNQGEINIEGKTYYADFLIGVSYFKKVGSKFEFDFSKNIVIEVDGHDFHQKTKEQVEHDNKRERALQKAGYEVIRFSGTEVYHKAYKCANEVLSFILSKCEYKVES